MVLVDLGERSVLVELFKKSRPQRNNEKTDHLQSQGKKLTTNSFLD